VDEPVVIEFRINNGELELQSRRAVNAILGVGSSGSQAAAGVNKLAGELKSLGAGFVGISAMKKFAEQVVSMRGEIQQLGIAFETMLDSKQKADAMMQDIIQFAQKTPFTLTEVADNTKQLMAMGIASEKVMDTMRALGDVAAGVSVPISRLAINYGQVAALGNLQQREIRDFAMAGVPIVAELAKMLNKTSAEITNMVSAGDIGFPLVEQAFKSMSSEGGKFYNLMEKQNASVTGQVSKLKDQIQIMFNSIGEANEGVIYGAIDAASSLVANYEKVGAIITSLISTYGAYRAAVMTVTVTENIRAIAATAHAAGMTTMQGITDALRIKMALLNKTMLANPYVLAATAIVGLVTVMVALGDSTSVAEQSLKAYNEKREDALRAENEHKSRIESLINAVNDESAATYQRVVALKDLQKQYPDIFAQYDIETLKLADILKLKKQIAELDGQRQIKEARDEATKIQDEIKSLETERNRVAMSGTGTAEAQVGLIERKLSRLREDLKNTVVGINKQADAMWEANTPLEVRQKALQSQIDALKEANSQLDAQIIKQKELNETGDVTTFKPTAIDEAAFQANAKRIAELEEMQKSSNSSAIQDAIVKNKAYWEDVKKKAEAARDALDSTSPSDKKDWDELTEKIIEAEKYLKIYNKTSNEKEENKAEKVAENRLKAQQQILARERELSLERERVALDVEQKLLDIEQDGFDKTLKQNELNHRKEIQSIKEFESARIKEQQKAAEELYTAEKGTDKGFDFSKFDKTKLPQGLLDSDIENYVNQLTDAADKALADANKNTLKAMLDQYQYYATQRLSIEKKYNDDIAALNSQRATATDTSAIDAAIAEAERQKNAAIAGLDTQYRKSTTAITKLFSDMRKKSVADMRAIADEARQMTDFIVAGDWDEKAGAQFGITKEQFKQLNEEWRKSPDALKAIVDAIEKIEKEADDADGAFGRFNAGLKRIISSFQTGSEREFAEGLQQITSSANSLTGALDLISKGFASVAEATNNDKLKAAASTMQDISENISASFQGAQAGGSVSGNQWGAVIGAVIGGVTSLVGIIAKYKQSRDELRDTVETFTRQEYLAEYEINRLFAERYEWAQKIGESMLDYSKRQGEEIKRQSNSNVTDQFELWRDLMQQDFIKGEHFEKTGLFGWGKGKIVQDLQKMNTAGLSEDDVERLYVEGKLTDKAKEYYESWKAAREEGDALADRQEEYLEQVRETLAGSTYSSVVDSIVEGFKAGKRSAADFADTFNDLMTNALSSALKMMTDDKMRSWYENFARMGEGGFTDEEIAAAKESFTAAIEAIGADADMLKQIADFSTQSQQTAEKGDFRTVSQESFDLWLGQFTAIRIHVGDISALLAEFDFQSTALVNHLAAIEKNTADTVAELKMSNRYFKTVVTEGVKIL
jgi:tape measure domain-containing protein